MKLSFNSWLYGQANGWLPLRSIEDTVDTIAELGYDGIEIGAATPHAYPPFLDAKGRRDLLGYVRSRGLEVSGICPALGGAVGYNSASPEKPERDATVEYMKQCCELARDLEAGRVIWIAGWTRYGQSKRDAWSNAVETLQRSADAAASCGVQLVVEPTSEVSNLTDDVGDVLRLIDESQVDTQVVKVMIDTIHVMHRADDIRAQIAEAGSELGYVHLSDANRGAPGDENDFRSVIGELQRVNYDSWLSMEIGFTQRSYDPDAVAARALAHVRGLVGGK